MAAYAAPILLDVLPDGVAWLTLNRPDAANSRNQAMREALMDSYSRLSDDPAVRCLVLTGAGDRHFCAGMDLKESARQESLMSTRARLGSARDIEVLAKLPIPTIAAINGTALGGGFEMALACDLRYMATEADVGLPELTHGLVPAGGATRRLPKLIGKAKAYELIYLGTRLGGVDAEAAGLVNRAVPRTDLRACVEEVATTIAGVDRHALMAAKRLIAAGEAGDSVADMELDALLMLIAEQRTNRAEQVDG